MKTSWLPLWRWSAVGLVTNVDCVALVLYAHTLWQNEQQLSGSLADCVAADRWYEDMNEHAVAVVKSLWTKAWTSAIVASQGRGCLIDWNWRSRKKWDHLSATVWSAMVPLPSARQHPSYNDCLEVKREHHQTAFAGLCDTVFTVALYMSSSYRSNRLGLSHWDPYAMRRGGCLESYYCDRVEWFWWDSSLISITNWFQSTLKWPIMCWVEC